MEVIILRSLRKPLLQALLVAAIGLIAAASTATHGATDCNSPSFDYKNADLSAPMRFFLPESSGCYGNAVSDSYLAVGTITPETPAAFAEFSRKHPPGVPIEFTSPGGNLLAGLKLGGMIRAEGYDTSLGKWCASTCAFAILGGVRRYIAEKKFNQDSDYDNRVVGAIGTKLGIHQFYKSEALTAPLKKAFTAADMSADQMLTGILLEYTLRMGVDTRFVSAASGVLPQHIRWLTPDEMLSWNVDNVQRRYSPLVLRPFGASGSYVEVRNTRGPDSSYLRIFCQHSVREPLFAFITDTPFQISPTSSVIGQRQIAAARERIRNLLGRMNIAFEFGSNKPLAVPMQIQNVQGILQGKHAVRVFAVVRPSALGRQDAERLTRVALEDNGNLSRSEWTFQDIVKFRIQGDHRLIRLAMKNCVQ